jgi:anti-sigma factor RsiW
MIPNCQELIAFLDDYVAGELPRERADDFERHLALCVSCAAYLASYRETIRAARFAMAVEIEEIPPDLFTAILVRVTARK